MTELLGVIDFFITFFLFLEFVLGLNHDSLSNLFVLD